MRISETSLEIKIAVLVCVLFLGVVISPFLSTLLLAAVLVTGAMPVHKWILKKVKNRDWLAALITSSVIGIIFSVAFIVFFILLSQEAISIYEQVDTFISEGKFDLHELITSASNAIGITPTQITSSITDAAQSISTTLVRQSTDLIKSIVWLFINFILLVVTMFFFFKDGNRLVDLFERALPLPKPYGHEILLKFKQVSRGMLYGIFLTAFLQGIIGGIGLALAGVENPIFWGTAMGFLGMVPVLGTAIIWIPAAAILFVNGHLIAALGLCLWCGLLVVQIDNIVKPLLISKHVDISPLATFLVVLGGLLVFGLEGAIVAPMVLAAFMAFMNFEDRAHDSQQSLLG